MAKIIMRQIILITIFIFFSAGFGMAAASYQAGFRTIGAWVEDDRIRLDLNVWYPASKQERELNYSPWVVNGALNAKCAKGKFPVLLLSHASPANRFSYHDLAEFLARNGFFVIAPTHRHDSIDNMDDLYTWKQLERRMRELELAVAAVGRLPDLAASMDYGKMGVIGFGSGGATALLLGGAKPNCVNWHSYCKEAGRRDVYCIKWARDRMNEMCLGGYWSEPETPLDIKAVAVINPAYGMLFDKNSFDRFHAKILLVAAEKDMENRVGLHCDPIARILGKRARYLSLPEADAGAMMSRCPAILETEMPDLCQSVLPEKRKQILAKLERGLLSFFSGSLESR